MVSVIFARANAPDFTIDGADWPHRSHSDFIACDGQTWHVQRFGRGPVALLLHGVGASTHSMALLGSALSAAFEVVAVDLPGHGFTRTPVSFAPTLPRVASSVARLLEQEALRPALVVGHSAGAAIMLRMMLDKRLAPTLAVSINGALSPFKGAAGVLFPVMAKLLYLNPVTPHLFAAGARDPARIARLIGQTGSQLPAAEADRYRTLLRRAGHVAGALRMMAYWDLAPLMRELPSLDARVLFVAGNTDAAIAPDEAMRAAALVRGARTVRLDGVGHLAHEEDPARLDRIVKDAFSEAQHAWPLE